MAGVYGRYVILGCRGWNFLPIYDFGPEGPRGVERFSIQGLGGGLGFSILDFALVGFF